MKISYIKIRRYKYELPTELTLLTGITGYNINHPYFSLSEGGFLTIRSGYKWDGVSGPAWDTNNTMIGGCVHDALYQMIRLELINESCKQDIDIIFKDILLRCKMSEYRAAYYYWAVDNFGKYSCIPGDVRIPKVITLEC